MLFKKHISFFMVLLMAAPIFVSTGLSLYTLFLQHSMKEKLELAQLQKVTIKKNEVQWKMLGNEIIIDGQLFDVKDQLDEGNSIVFYGLFDKEETFLQNKIDNQHAHSNEQQALVSVVHFLQSVHFLSQPTTAVHNDFPINSSIGFTLIESKPMTPYLNQHTKPPESFLFS